MPERAPQTNKAGSGMSERGVRIVPGGQSPDGGSAGPRADGPAAAPPAIFVVTESQGGKADQEGEVGLEDRIRQLSLPLEEESRAAVQPAGSEPVRRGKAGFKRVTRDADVARSYSDNVALGYAVARGLADVLAGMAPSELAALRARVAQAASRVKKYPSRVRA